MTCVIAGVGRTHVGRLPEFSAEDLYDAACLNAIADTGIDPDLLDGVITANSRVTPVQNHADAVADRLGIGTRFTLTLATGGANTLRALQIAAELVASQRARAVIVAAADNLLTGWSSDEAVASLSTTGYGEMEVPFGAFAPALFALSATRHAAMFGTTPDDLAAVSVLMRDNAVDTEGAHFRSPITIGDVNDSPMVASPLRRLDCAPISDGGGAVVVTDRRLMTGASTPVIWSSYGEARGPRLPYASDVARRGTLTEAAGRALEEAGTDIDSIDRLIIYDPFTIETLVSLEAIGLCEPGEGRKLVANGYVSRNGPLPLNLHGGLLSFGHPGRAGAILQVVEAVRELRKAPTGVRRCLLTAEGAMLSTYAAAVLEKDET